MWERAHGVRHEDREMERAENDIHYYKLCSAHVVPKTKEIFLTF